MGDYQLAGEGRNTEKRELKVIYTGERDFELDKTIEQFATSIGFKEWARGYSFNSHERDFAFDEE